MLTRDFAIIVGLPNPAAPAHIEARRVANDVAAMRAWLADPAGGQLPAERIRCLAQPLGPQGGRTPPRAPLVELDALLAELEAQARRNLSAGRSPRLGRRLYLYISGLACLPGRGRPASQGRPPAPLAAMGWLAWAQDSGLFQEVVVWLDCAQEHPAVLSRRDPVLLPLQPGGRGPSFVALAARRPSQPPVLSLPQEGGRWHGAFTWALLQGLRGAATDASGRVTGRSLGNWLRHAQAALLPAGAPAAWSAEPEVLQVGGDVLLAEGVAPPLYPVQLEFPAAALGQPVRLWQGSPAWMDPALGLAQPSMALALPPGLYLVEVPGAGLRQGFAVLGPTRLAITQQGAPVAAESLGQMLPLTVPEAEPATQLALLDQRLALARHAVGNLQARLPAGLYALRSRQGRALRHQVFMLDATQPSLAVPPPPPSPDAALPPLRPGACAKAMLRVVGLAAQGISVADGHGLTVLDLVFDGDPVPGQPGLVHADIVLPPGQYFLRQQLGATRRITAPWLEQSLVLAAGWALKVRVPPREPLAEPGPVGLRMQPLAGPADPAQHQLAEALGIALADRRRILTPALEAALCGAVTDPLVGILAGHLMLLDQEYDPGRDLAALDGLVRRLQALLGPAHPDVQALALRCTDPALRPSGALAALPMFYRSWHLLVAASHQSSKLLPRRFWERAVARRVQAPFLAWSMDAGQRAAAQRDLALATWGSETLPAAREPRGNVVPLMRPRRVRSHRAVARKRALLLDVPLSALDMLADVYEDHAEA